MARTTSDSRPFSLVSVVMLQLRQQRMELNYQTNRLHSQIEQSQAKLWNQQLQIAKAID